MRRRDFLAVIGGATAWPMAARAQSRTPVIGFLSSGSGARGPSLKHAIAIRQGLEDMGFADGKNVAIEYRWADDQYDRLSALAADLERRVTVMVIGPGPSSVDTIKALPPTTPVVFMAGGDPIRQGLVTNLNRPGGNLTGVSILASDLNGKRFGLFRDLVPKATVIGVLTSGTPAQQFAMQEVQAAAQARGVSIRVVTAATEREIEAAFATLAQDGLTTMFVVNNFLSYSLSDRLAALALQYRMALSGELRVFVEFGGLMYYGPNELEMFRQTGRYAGRILKGEKPGDLPVVLPTRFEFAVNLKTAKAIGLDIPSDILSAADEIIE